MSKEEIDSSVCPICGRPNNCARVRDPNASDCWCRKVNFPPSLWDYIPANKQTKACICRHCLERILAQEKLNNVP